MSIDQYEFPLCQLHGTNIVHGFPEGCPLGDDDMGGSLAAMQDGVWQNVPDQSDRFVAAEAMFKTCNGCVTRLSANQHVQFLRRAMASG